MKFINIIIIKILIDYFAHHQGITFIPMVVETTGIWDLVAAKVLK